MDRNPHFWRGEYHDKWTIFTEIWSVSGDLKGRRSQPIESYVLCNIFLGSPCQMISEE